MPLSDKEIQDLLEKTEAYKESKSSYLPDLEQALECYDKIIENAPEHSQYFSRRSDVKFRLNARLNRKDLLEGAIEDINKAIQLDPDQGWYYYLRGVCLWEKFEEGNISDAAQLLQIISDYKSCLSRTPTEASPWLDLIAINIISYNWDEAISLYGQCKPYITDKVDQLYRSHLGCLAFIFAGDPIEEEDIRSLRDQSIRIDTSISRELHIGSFLIKIHGKEEYKEKWSKAVEIEKFFINHYDDLPLRDLMSGAFEEPGKYDYSANDLLSNNSDLLLKGKDAKNKTSHLFGIIRAHRWLIKGVNLKKLGKYDEAIKCYDEALRINPDDSDVWKSKGIALKKLGKYVEAVKCYDEAIRINPKAADAWYNKGMSLNKLGKYDEEIKCYDEAIKINPEYDNAWYNKGVALADLGKYDEAIKCYDEAIRINPKAADAISSKAIALAGKLGKYNGEVKTIIGNFTWKHKGNSFYKLGKYAEAAECYDEAISINPKDADAWFSKGAALYKLGKYDEAIKCYDETIRINPEYANAWYNKGVALADLGKYDEAIKCYDEAISINPKDSGAWNNKRNLLSKDKI